jgi:hypothetical protein
MNPIVANLSTITIIYSLTNNYVDFIEKDTWEFKVQEPLGKYLVIEKMTANKWTKSLRKKIQMVFQELFPSFEEAIWQRSKSNEYNIKVRRNDLCHTR